MIPAVRWKSHPSPERNAPPPAASSDVTVAVPRHQAFGIVANAAPAPRRAVATAIANGLAISSCGTPPPVTNFTTSSLRVWFYFIVTGVNAGDSAQVQFIRPDGAVYTTLRWSPFPAGISRILCFFPSIAINGAPAAAFQGTWKAQND